MDALLAAGPSGTDICSELAPVADLLGALTAPAGREELAHEGLALAAFRAKVAVSPPARSHRRRPALLTTLLGAKLAVAAAAGAAGLGGLSAAAYAGALPTSVQNFAHHTVGAPTGHAHGPQSGTSPILTTDPTSSTTPSPSTTPTTTPIGPDATGSAAYGLCTAYSHAKAAGNAASRAVAFRNLATAAGGSDQIDTYCATVQHPGPTPTTTVEPSTQQQNSPTGGPTAKPTALPSQAASHAPNGLPTTHPSGAPTNPGGTNPNSHAHR